MKITLFYDHVTVLDYAYLDDHLGAVGNSLIVNVEFVGHTDAEGVVYDFSHAKNKVKEIIDRECDHRLVVPHKLLNKDNPKKVKLDFKFGYDDLELHYEAPSEAFIEIPFGHASEDNLKSHLENLVLAEMPATVDAIKLTFVKENRENDLYFHYCISISKASL